MSNTLIPTNVTALRLFFRQPLIDVQNVIKDAVNNNNLNKQFTARLIDMFIKRINKEREELEVIIERVFPADNAIRRDEMLHGHASGEAHNALLRLNKTFSAISYSEKPFVSEEGLSLSILYRDNSKKALESRAQLTHILNAAHTIKEALSLNSEEKTHLYRSIEAAYAEQVRNRQWYQRDAVKIISLIFFPVLFPLYLFWKKHREAENIQVNEHSITDKIIARKNRQQFKKYINTLENHQNEFITEKRIVGNYDAPPPLLITKHKKATNEFFRRQDKGYSSNNDLNVTKDIALVIQSKQDDEGLRMNLGIR